LRDVRRFHDSLIRGLGRVMTFDGFGADSFFGNQFPRGAEEVMEEPPFLGVEVVEQGYDLGVVQSFIAQPLSHVSPVFLLHMGVIIPAVSPASGKVDWLLSLGEMSQEVVIEEFGAVIAIEAEQGKGQGLFDGFDLLQHPGLPLAPDGALFGPAGGEVDEVQGIGEQAGQGFPAMGHTVRLQESRAGLLPLVGLNGDVSFQQGSGLGGGPAPFLILDPHRIQKPIDRGRGDPPEKIGDLGGQIAEVLSISGQPQRYNGLEPFGAGQIGCQPDPLQG